MAYEPVNNTASEQQTKVYHRGVGFGTLLDNEIRSRFSGKAKIDIDGKQQVQETKNRLTKSLPPPVAPKPPKNLFRPSPRFLALAGENSYTNKQDGAQPTLTNNTNNTVLHHSFGATNREKSFDEKESHPSAPLIHLTKNRPKPRRKNNPSQNHAVDNSLPNNEEVKTLLKPLGNSTNLTVSLNEQVHLSGENKRNARYVESKLFPIFAPESPLSMTARIEPEVKTVELMSKSQTFSKIEVSTVSQHHCQQEDGDFPKTFEIDRDTFRNKKKKALNKQSSDDNYQLFLTLSTQVTSLGLKCDQMQMEVRDLRSQTQRQLSKLEKTVEELSSQLAVAIGRISDLTELLQEKKEKKIPLDTEPNRNRTGSKVVIDHHQAETDV